MYVLCIVFRSYRQRYLKWMICLDRRRYIHVQCYIFKSLKLTKLFLKIKPLSHFLLLSLLLLLSLMVSLLSLSLMVSLLSLSLMVSLLSLSLMVSLLLLLLLCVFSHVDLYIFIRIMRGSWRSYKTLSINNEQRRLAP